MSKPVLQALLLADQVYTDRETGKQVVCGVFDRVGFLRPPTPPGGQTGGSGMPATPAPVFASGSPSAFVSLTEIRGTRQFELRFVDLADDAVLLTVGFELASEDPLKTVRFAVRLPVLPFRNPGTYVLELLCDGETLGGHRIEAVAAPPPG